MAKHKKGIIKNKTDQSTADDKMKKATSDSIKN